MKNTIGHYILSLLSGLLLGFSWFPHGFSFLVFIAFVPLLIVEHEVSSSTQKKSSLLLFVYSYITFFTWNIIVTWWVKNASFGGAAMAILCNALLMTFVFMLFHKTKKRLGEKYAAIIFIAFWIAWEYFHLHWDLSWPWLTLGNVFADTLSWIQWYEYTGVFGGSLWILVINCMIAHVLAQREKSQKSKIKKGILIVSIVIIPIIFSVFVGVFANKFWKGGIDIVIVQPNIDPYNEKFTGDYDEQVIKMLQLAAQKVNEKTDYLILPETALADNIWEDKMEEGSAIQLLRKFLERFPNLKIVVGASTLKIYQSGEKLSATVRKLGRSEQYYDSYNTALQLDSSSTIQIYHKSKLVPGVEKMPFPAFFKLFEDFAIDMGGTSGSLGTQDERTVLRSMSNNLSTAPVVCYESVYGEYVAEYINNGAQFISIITNDGWWGDTPGYKQHLQYGALRAIETRKWVARSANTGISCFINPLGEISQPTEWWKPAVISATIYPDNAKTFYVQFGDYIAKVAVCLALLFYIYSLLFLFKILKK